MPILFKRSGCYKYVRLAITKALLSQQFGSECSEACGIIAWTSSKTA
jgi:hypothetical protein